MDKDIGNTFKDKKLLKGIRQPPNLKKLLCRAKFDSQKGGITKCGDGRCKICNFIQECENFKFKNSTKDFTIK